jgi:predicted RNA-binding Zn-ribbon protein involved in translation (DUF1610 family)
VTEVTLDTKYKAGHTIKHTFTDTALYCPNCGKQSVWIDTGGGDYYVGETHLCVSCDTSFYLPNIGSPDDADQQAIAAIRAALNTSGQE